MGLFIHPLECKNCGNVLKFKDHIIDKFTKKPLSGTCSNCGSYVPAK